MSKRGSVAERHVAADTAPKAGARSNVASLSTRETRAFAQPRAKATYDALLVAARAVFSDKGFDAAQTPDIAAVAGVSVGTFYRYFGDKRQAFLEVIRAHLASTHEKIIGSLSAGSFARTLTDGQRREAVDEVIDILFRHSAEFPRLHHVFFAMSLRDPDVAELREHFEDLAQRQIAAILAEVVSKERVPDPLAAARVIALASQEVAIVTSGARDPSGRGKTRVTRDEVLATRRALGDMIHRYLFATDMPVVVSNEGRAG